MLAWLQELSPFALAVVCSGSFVLVTWAGIIFLRPFLRLLLRRQPGADDLVSFTVATYHNTAEIQSFVQRRSRKPGSCGSGASSSPFRAYLNQRLLAALER